MIDDDIEDIFKEEVARLTYTQTPFPTVDEAKENSIYIYRKMHGISSSDPCRFQVPVTVIRLVSTLYYLHKLFDVTDGWRLIVPINCKQSKI